MKELVSYVIITISLLSAVQQLTSGFGGGIRGNMGGGMMNFRQMPQIPQSQYPAKRSKYR